MPSRATIFAALVLAEAAIAGAGMIAVHGDDPSRWFAPKTPAPIGGDPNLVEGGPHKFFDAGSHPALTIDIGNADLTLLTGSASQFDVSVSKSEDFGFFRSTTAISATKNGDTIHVAKVNEDRAGDNRMVTIVLPAATQVTIANAGDIQATGLRAAASIQSHAGDVTVTDYDAPALHVETARGRISLHDIAAPSIDITASDDRVEGTGLRVHDGHIDSDDRVKLEFVPGTDATVNAQTDSGKISMTGLTPSQPATKGDGDDDDSSSESVRVGDGTGHLDVHSNDGNIYLSE